MGREPQASDVRPVDSAEAALREFSPHPYQSLSETGEIQAVNDAWIELLGYDREDVEGEPFEEFLTPESAERFRSLYRECKDDGRTGSVEFELVHADGHTVVVSLDGRIEYDNGNFVRAHCQWHDITEHKERERELERYEAIVENSTDVPAIVDPDGTITYVSPPVRQVLGYEPEELTGEIAYEFIHPDDHGTVTDALESAREHPDESRTIEIRFRSAEGSWRWIEVRMWSVLDHDVIDGILVSTREITERKEREQELDEQRQQYTTLVEQSHEGVVIVQDQELKFVNQPMAEMTGHTEEELLGRPFYEIIAPEYRDLARERYKQRVGGEHPKQRYDIEIVTSDGDQRYIDLEVSRIQYRGKPATLATFNDITERKEREQALERYERLVESLPVGVYQNTAGPEGTFTLLNPAMVELFDADSKDQLREYPVSELYSNPDERAQFSERLAEKGVVENEEIRLETLDGEDIWVSVTAIAREVDGTTVFDGAIQNITERRQYERRLQEQRDNLDVLNQVVRHDIRNDLQLVTAYADLIGDHADEEGREYVEMVRESAKHAVELTKTARDMADIMLTAADDRQPVDLRDTLDRELDEIRSTHSEAIITVDGSVPAVSVRADDMLDSVFRNLLKNAVQHNDEDVPEVTVSVTEADDSVEVRIADNGPGVPDNQKEDIFGKGEKGLDSEGTGLGLYLVRTLVDHYGGGVWVEDNPSGGNETDGAVFVVRLPRAETTGD